MRFLLVFESFKSSPYPWFVACSGGNHQRTTSAIRCDSDDMICYITSTAFSFVLSVKTHVRKSSVLQFTLVLQLPTKETHRLAESSCIRLASCLARHDCFTQIHNFNHV